MRTSEEPWWAGAVAGAFLLAGLALFARANLPVADFWYDEGMQFWMSRGVDGFAPPNTPDGGLRAVIRENGRGNLDPGGFSLLLHVWMRGGADPAWLRLLPFGMFVAGLAAMAWLAWLWRPSVVFALFGAALPLGFPFLVYHATELRAYTMEFAGVVVGCLLLCRIQAGAGPATLVLTGATLAVFMGSRYSYSIFVGALCLVLLPLIWRRGAGGGRARLAALLALGAPLAVGAAFVAVNLWLQRGRLTYQGGALIEYLQPATIAGKTGPELARAIAVNLLSPAALPVTLGMIIGLLPEAWRRRAPANLLGLGATPASRTIYRLAPGILLLSALLWRWHPWDVNRKWSLYLHAMAAVLALRMVADVLEWLRPSADAAAGRGRWVGPASTALVALAVIGLGLHVATERRRHREDLTAALRHLEAEPLAAGSVAVATHQYPSLRYLCERGPFVGRLPYPVAFRLPSRGGPKPLIGPATRYLIAYGGPEWVARAFPGIRFRRDGSRPPNLHEVEPADGPMATRDSARVPAGHPPRP